MVTSQLTQRHMACKPSHAPAGPALLLLLHLIHLHHGLDQGLGGPPVSLLDRIVVRTPACMHEGGKKRGLGNGSCPIMHRAWVEEGALTPLTQPGLSQSLHTHHPWRPP